MLNNWKGWRALVAIAAMVLGMGSSVMAQSTRGSIAGTVRDAQGAAVPGATIDLETEAGSRKLAGLFTILLQSPAFQLH